MEPMAGSFLAASVLAAVGRGPERTSITGTANQLVKECNRIAAMVHELGKPTVPAGELEDCIRIQGIDYSALEIPASRDHCYDNHRVAMGFSIPRIPPFFKKENASAYLSGAELLEKSQVRAELVKKGSHGTIVITGMRGAGKIAIGIGIVAILNRPLEGAQGAEGVVVKMEMKRERQEEALAMCGIRKVTIRMRLSDGLGA